LQSYNFIKRAPQGALFMYPCSSRSAAEYEHLPPLPGERQKK